MTGWRVNFPKIRNPANRRDYLIVHMKPIKDARPGVPFSFCDVTGFDCDGKWYKFRIPYKVWLSALRNPVLLVEAPAGMPAPPGSLVDASGKSVLG